MTFKIISHKEAEPGEKGLWGNKKGPIGFVLFFDLFFLIYMNFNVIFMFFKN